MTAAYFLQLLLISALWGASFPILRVITPELGAAVTALLRISIATATLALLMRALDLRWPWSSWRELTLLGLGAVALPFLLFSFAALKAPAGYLALLNPLAVVFAVLSSAWFKEDTLDAHKIVGCILGFVGLGLGLLERCLCNVEGRLGVVKLLLTDRLFGNQRHQPGLVAPSLVYPSLGQGHRSVQRRSLVLKISRVNLKQGLTGFNS